MIKAYRYRVYPAKPVLRSLERTLEECRWLYNQTLGVRTETWEKEKRHVGLYDTQGLLTQWKAQRTSLRGVYSQVLQNVNVRVDLAMQAFFRRCKEGAKDVGYPRFKGKGRYDSITYPQSGFELRGNMLHLSKIGDVRIVLHRPLDGQVKTLTLTRSSTGKWYACFSVSVEPKRLPVCDREIGIDVGLHSFYTDSEGTAVTNPRFFRTEEKALAKVQRAFSKTEKGTLARMLRRKPVARVHERIGFRRDNFIQQESRRIVNTTGTIAVEDLTINRMVHNHCLAKSIHDAAWSQFFVMIASKAEEAGRRFIKVNPAYTSQTCHACGHRADTKLTLADRIFVCTCCGLVLDRDHNAALNIRALGLQCVGSPLEAPPFTDGE